jgi:hypothetical protein
MHSIDQSTSEKRNSKIKNTQSAFNKNKLNRILREHNSAKEVYDKA